SSSSIQQAESLGKIRILRPRHAERPQKRVSDRRFTKLAIRSPRFVPIFAFFGVLFGKTVFCPAWITYSSRLRSLNFARDNCRGGRWTGRFWCRRRKALVPNPLFLQFSGGSWQIANSAVSRSFCSWRFARA